MTTRASITLRTFRKALYVASLAVLVSALAGAAASSSAAAPAAGVTSATASSPNAAARGWQAGAPARWNKILAAGRKEGSLVLNAPPQLLNSSVASAFKRDTGITLKYAGGESGARLVSMSAEADANKLTVDASVGGGAELLTMVPAGTLRPLTGLLMLPTVTNKNNWRGNKMFWVDQGNKLMVQGTRHLTIPYYVWSNADLVDPKIFRSPLDLLKPQFKGKIASFDPIGPGTGQAIAAEFFDQYGEDFVRNLYRGQQVTFAKDRGTLAQWVARGTYSIVIGANPSDMKPYKDQGINIQPIAPDKGIQYVDGGSGVLKLPRNKDGSLSPSPNAAIVFANWYLSQPGQQAFTQAMIDISLRKDVAKPAALSSTVIPRTDRPTIDAYHWKWYSQTRPEAVAAVQKALG
jgi:ABC-type Fe3+ transport system substrate-binding protein